MNRMTRERGKLSSGVISGGVSYTYDAAGQRVTSSQTDWRTTKLWKYLPASGPQKYWYYDDSPTIYPDDGEGTLTYADYHFNSTFAETYSYNADGTLASVQVAYQDIADIPDWGRPTPRSARSARRRPRQPTNMTRWAA